MKRFVPFLLSLVLMLTACAGPAVVPQSTDVASSPVTSAPPDATQTLPTELPKVTTITVLADASLSNAFAQMAENVQASHPGLVVEVRYGEAQVLRQQIEQGQPADVFASANVVEMDSLVTGKNINPQDINVFLVNQLVIALPALNTANLATLQDLTKPGIKVALAAQETTLGKSSQQLLENLDKTLGVGYKDNLLKNVTSYEQDASQVLNLVALGKVDAGIVYASDLSGAPQLQSIKIPSENNVILQYVITVLIKSTNPDLAKIFVDYVLSPNGEAILQRWGFMQDR